VLPDPLVPFAGARYEQTSTYTLAPTASLVTVDILSCGRSARGERWAFARYASRTRIDATVNDALVLDASEMDIARMMGRFDAFATLFAVGPLARLRVPSPPVDRANLVFSSNANETCVRVASTHIASLLGFVRDVLVPVRADLGDDPFVRKW
jgi:urease accessory protein